MSNHVYALDSSIGAGDTVALSGFSGGWSHFDGSREYLFVLNVYADNAVWTSKFGQYFSDDLSQYICGDANRDCFVDISDAVWIINYVFSGGPAPIPYESGDANCDDIVDVSDAAWIMNYVFLPEYYPAPCDTDNDGDPDC
jgi:hypothetical protein